MTNAIEIATALIAGGMIGFGFGLMQSAALLRHEKRERSGDFHSAWSIMPGSGGRIAMLMMTLVVIQVVCPMLFINGIQWWVSGGVLFGYGSQLGRQLIHRRIGRI